MYMINYGNNEKKRSDINFKYERDLNIQKGCTYNDIELYKLKNRNQLLEIYKQLSKINIKSLNKENQRLVSSLLQCLNNANYIITQKNHDIQNLTTVTNAAYFYYNENENSKKDKNDDNYVELNSNDYIIK